MDTFCLLRYKSTNCFHFKFTLDIFSNKVLDAVKARLKPAIPDTWLSEKFLIGCLERKGGGLQKGDMVNYRQKWGKKGIQEGKTGGSETWYYPPEFLTKQLKLAIIKNRQVISKYSRSVFVHIKLFLYYFFQEFS